MIPVETLLLHTPPPSSLFLSEYPEPLLVKLLKSELEEAFFVRGTKTDDMNWDFEDVSAFLLLSLCLVPFRGGLNQQ